MPWFKIDDGFWSHPKVLELTDEAIALWVRAGSYCAGHLTDGEVKRSTLRVLAADHNAATELVIAGLWDQEDGRWRFHDWADYQPTREEVMKERAAAAERMRRVRANKQANEHGTNGDGSASPSRPVPTRPDLVTNVSKSSYVSSETDENPTKNPLAQSLKHGYNVDAVRVQAAITAKAGRDVSLNAACGIALDILGRAQGEVKSPQAYVLGSITKSWAEVQKYIDTEGTT